MTPRPSRRFARRLFVALFVLAAADVASAQPTGPQPWWPTQPPPPPLVHSLFTSDAVLQRDVAAPIWGWSAPGERITVEVDGRPAGEPAIAGDDGRWTTRIGPFPAGGPHEIRIVGGERRQTLTNVLFGDVWLCTGQSNMNWPVRLAKDAEQELKSADYPEIRSFNVGFYSSLVPMRLPPAARWEVCTPELARNFSAVGYFFAREIHKTKKIPIGILHSSAGASAAEAWTSGEALRKKMPFDFQDRLADLERTSEPFGADYDFFRALEQWTAKVDPASAAKKYASDPNLDVADWIDLAVPKPWQEAAVEADRSRGAPSGLADFHGLVWFRRELDLPESWGGRDLLLQLSVIRDSDVVWWNGELLGSQQTPGIRNYKVEARRVRAGKNLLVAAIVNKEGPGGFCSAPSNMALRPVSADGAGGGAEIVRPAGVWKVKRSVRFEDLATPFPSPAVGHYKTITSLYNGMIAPLAPYRIKGALWYQGEANGPFWMQYRRLLPTLIGDWRTRFESGEFPFLIVSLAAYNPLQTKPVEPGWAEIRESQWRTARTVPNVGLAMTIDIGDGGDIHPRNKQEVGRRLALVARRMAYGEPDLVASGPEFTEMQVEPPKGDRIRLYFKNVGGGLTIKSGDARLTGFAVAGVDKNFVWADAVIDGSTIVVSSPEVPEPKHVRYGWAWNPIVNLYNKEGLPAITFRTDE